MKVSELERQLNLVTTQASTTQLKKQKKKSRKKGINSRAKGGRVERELVAWLKERGIASAERTAQRCGKGGPSDVVAKVELPSFHIEVKGTAGANLSKSTILDWLDQIKRDCVVEQIPIIFHKANGKDWTALITADTLEKFRYTLSPHTHFTFGKSFNPSEHLDHESSRSVYRTLLKVENYSSTNKFYFVAYPISTEQVVLACSANQMLPLMLWLEKKIKGFYETGIDTKI